MKRTYGVLSIAVIMAGSFCPVAAMNGKAVVVIQRQTGYYYENQRKSNLVIATIVNNEVTANDTILRTGIGQELIAPQFSFDAKKIAFARNVTLNGSKAVALSVIDIDGKNLRDLGYYDMSHAEGTPNTINHQNSAWINLDWPKGDWIYYFCGGSGSDRDNGDCIIWRVNVNDSASKYRVANYAADVARFSLSANGLYSAVDVYRAVNYPNNSNGPRLTRFPAHNSDATLFWDDPNTRSVIGSNYCNSALSASGTLMWHFSGAHNKIDFCFWNHATDKCDDYVQVLGPSSSCSTPQGPGGVCYREIDNWLGLQSHDLFDYNTNSANAFRKLSS